MSRVIRGSVFVTALAVACGGKVMADSEESAGGSGGTAAMGGVGGAGTGGSSAVGGAAGMGATAGVGGSGGPAPSFCTMEVLGEGALPPAEGNAVFDGPALVPMPSGFVIGYLQAQTDGANGGFRLMISDSGGIQSAVELTMAPCAAITRSDGVAAAWNEDFGAGLMAISTQACSDDDTPLMHAWNFDGQGQTIAGMSYSLPSRVRFSPVKALAPAPRSGEFILAAMAEETPFRYVFHGVDVQTDPPPKEVHPGSGNVTFVQMATSANQIVMLTDSDDAGGKLLVSMEQVSTGAVKRMDLPPSTTTSLAAWGTRAAVVQASPASLDFAVIDDATTFQGGSVDTGPCSAVDTALLDDELLVVAARPGAWSLLRVAGMDQSPPITGTDESYVRTVDGYDGRRVAVAAARGRAVVAWLTTSEKQPTGQSPGGFVVLGCAE